MAQKKRKKSNKQSSKFLNIIKFISMVLVLSLFFGVGAFSGLVAALIKDDPIRSPQEINSTVFKNDLTGFAYFSNKNENDNNLQLIGMLRANEDRRFIQYNEIPKYVVDAFISIEDSDFWHHHGINIKSLSRAMLQQLLHSNVQTGGSTITQQLAKNSFLSFDQTYKRKAKEIFLALRIERILSKKQIFTAYINKIPFGKAANLNNVYGIQAASRGYFNIDAKELNLAESAFLAGIPQRPTAYSSFNSNGFDDKGYELAKDRQKLVLSRMLEMKYITKNEYDDALTFDIKASFSTSLKKAYDSYPYLMSEIENRAAEKIVEINNNKTDDYNRALENAKQELLTGGYKVYTTIDKKVYDAMNNVAKNPDNFDAPIDYDFTMQNGEVKKVKDALEQVGATLVQNKTGAILGFVGGRDFYISQINHSNFRGGTKRQPGSSIKPLLDYGPAMELGKIQPATPIDDTPLQGDWQPENWNHKYNGRITARTALQWSFNVPAVKVYEMVGKEEGYKFFKKLGFKTDKTTFLRAGYTPAIGTLGTSPEEITSAYTTFPNGGTRVDAYLIQRIEDKDGNVIYEHKSKPDVVFSEQTSYLMTNMMQTVVKSGTGRTVMRYLPDYDIAGKTGTTNDTKDVWFVGYTPELTLGVWVGYEYPYKLTDGAIASKAWGKLLAEVLKTEPNLSPKDEKFKVPDGIVQMEVSSTSGKLPSDLTKETGYLVTDIFNKRYIPTQVDDSLEKGTDVYYDGKHYIPNENTPPDMIETGIFYKRAPYEMPYVIDDETGEPKLDDNDDKIKRPLPVDYDKELPTEKDPRVSTGEAPTPPTNSDIKIMGYKNVISWDKVLDDNVVGYRIYRAGPSSLAFERIGSVLQKDLKEGRLFYEDNVTSDSYVYYVSAIEVAGLESVPSDYVGNSAIVPLILGQPSNGQNTDGTGTTDNNPPIDNNQNNSGGTQTDNNQPVTVVPNAPQQLSGSASALTIKLNWNQSPAKDQVTKYNVYFSTKENGQYAFIGSTDKNTFKYTLAITGDVYFYVTAENKVGESNPSTKIHLKNN